MAERAVNYCRCSTEEESQRDALKIQTMESREWIAKMGWLHVDEYVEAKSGTQMKGRTEYQRLFEDMQSDKFDIIVIKDQDRLMRNTKDWYLFLDRMLMNGKRLYMYLEQKWYTPDDALITGIRAILAEEYSRTLSKKINNAHRGRQEKGSTVVLNSNVYGFIKKGKEPPVIQPEEAEAINRMYDLSILGYGATRISRELWHEGFKDREGQPYRSTRIRRIIRNPLYMGTVVMNKLHFDFDTKKIIKNPPEDWVIHEDMLPAIVTKDKWQKANRAMDARLKKENLQIGTPDAHSNIPILSHKIKCGICNRNFYRTTRKNKSGTIKEWVCSGYYDHGKRENNIIGCNNIHVNEDILLNMLENLRLQYYDQKKNNNIVEPMLHILDQALQNTDKGIDIPAIQRKIAQLEHQKEILLNKLLEEVITDELYKKKNQELDADLQSLKEKLEQQNQKSVDRLKIEERLKRIRQWMEQGGLIRATVVEMIDDIKRIIVYPEYIEIVLFPKRLADLIQENPIRVKMEYPFPWTTEQGRRITEDKILDLWKRYPTMTVKELSVELDVPWKAVLGRVNHLKELGKVRYNGKGGKGYWEILTND